jgi:uncharacterized repeat protein (TIGR01451 family)
LRSRRLRIVATIGALALALGTVAATTVVLSPQSAHAAPGSPGTPQAGSVVFQEGFENGTGTTPVVLTSYTGTNGQKYTADSGWLTNCNGQIRSFNTPYTSLGNCTNNGDTSNLGQLAYALGAHNGDATPQANHAVTAYTENNPGANAREFQTVDNIPLASASGRYLTFSVDTAAVNCQVSAPLYQFSFLDQNGNATNVGGVINACASGTPVNVPAYGTLPARTVNVGTYAANGSVLFSGSTLGVRMVNANGSGVGNDAAFDNIRILDVTPQLDKSFSPAVVPTGATSKLTFTVTNTSELAAKNGWSFSDALPSGLTVASPSGAATTCPSGSVTAASGSSTVAVTGNLNAGQTSCTVTVNVTSSTTGSYTNGPDNVTTTGLDEPGTATVAFESPALSIVKHAGTPVDVNGNGVTDEGDTIQYTFDVTNTGDVPVSGVHVDDAKAGSVTCPTSTLAPNQSETCSADSVYTVTAADAQAGHVDNSATAGGTSPAGADVTSDPSTTSTPAVVAAPAISVVKSADPSDADSYQPGQVITYRFAVTNTGNVTMNDVEVIEGDFTGTGTLTEPSCPSSTLVAGEQMICSASYTLTPEDVDNGSVENSATAQGTPEGSDTPVPSDPSTVTIPETPAPGISIVKSADRDTVTEAGQVVTYSFVVTNTGNVTLTDPQIDDTDFSGTGQLSAIDCPQTSLIAGQIETCTATYTVTQADVDAGTLTNTATVTATPPSGDPLQPVPSNTVNVGIPATPSLSIVKTADVDAAAVGEKITYTFTVTNTGNVTVTDPQVTDTGFTGHGTLSEVVCPTGPITLVPGQIETCTATYTVTQEDIDAGSISNAAAVTGTQPNGDPTPEGTSDPVVLPTNPRPALTLVKAADTTRVTTVGQVVTYTFVVTNTGNVNISNPKVNEGTFTGHGTLSQVTCPSTTMLAPGQSIRCTATYTVVAADLAAGGTLSNTATVTGTTPGGDPLTSDPSTAKVTEVAPAAPAGLASTGSDLLVAGMTGLGLLIVGILAATVAWLQRRRRTS